MSINGNGEGGGVDPVARERAEIAINHALDLSAAIGKLTAEVAGMRVEMRQSFARLGERVGEARRRLSSVSDELDDTKSHDLKMLRRDRDRWRWAFIGAGFTIGTTAIAAAVLHALHLVP
jgi:hypothetical protein